MEYQNAGANEPFFITFIAFDTIYRLASGMCWCFFEMGGEGREEGMMISMSRNVLVTHIQISCFYS